MTDIVKDIKKKLGFDIEGIDIKSEIQEQLITAPFSSLTIYEISTGVGKTRPSLFKIGNKKTLIAISQILHEQNWRNEAAKWNVNLDNVTFVCYNSLHKYIGETFDFVILDEAHRWNESWTELLSKNNPDRIVTDEILVLSATLTQDVKKAFYGMGYGKPRFYTIPIEDAVEWGLLPEPQIRVKLLTLDNVTTNHIFEKGKDKKKGTEFCSYNEWTTKWKYIKSIDRPNLRIKCTEQQYYTILNDDIEWAKKVYFQSKNPTMLMRMKILGNQRKTWLATLKTKHVQSLLTKLSSDRVVVFAHNIEQAETFDKDAVHSKNKNGQIIIDEFNSYKRDLLVSVRQLQESLNLVDPNIGIIVQINNSKSSGKKKVSVKNSQSLGRIIRSQTPILYLFIYRTTQDEVYLNKFKESIDPNWFVNV